MHPRDSSESWILLCVLDNLAASLEACPSTLQVEETSHCDETNPTTPP